MSDLYRLAPCVHGYARPGGHIVVSTLSGYICAGAIYEKVKPTDRICDEHDASVDINDKPYCTQGINLEETAMCVLSDVVRIPKEHDDE